MQFCTANTTRSSQSGFILIAVLWGVLALAAIAALIGQTVRSHVSIADLKATQINQSLVAESALNRVLFALATKGDPLGSKLVADGRTVEWTHDGTDVAITIQSESGKLDLNAADLSTIAHVLERLVGNPIAGEMTESIRRNREAGRIFQTLNVVDQATLPAGAVAALKSVFTVHSGIPTIDPMTASPRLLAALPGSDKTLAKQIIERRTRGDIPQAARQRGLQFGRGLNINSLEIAIKQGNRLIPTLRVVLDGRKGQAPPRIVAWRKLR